MVPRSGIVIGIDFGTTFSGVAWSLRDGSSETEVLSEWPGGGNRTTPKVPTTLHYDRNGLLWGYQTGAAGHDLKGDVLRGFKLLLDESQEVRYRPAADSKIKIGLKRKLPMDIASDYLNKLLRHAKHILSRRFGNALNYMDCQYVLTVPAVWSDKAKDLTLMTAVNAGIPRRDINLVSEPEAAALHCLTVMQPNAIKDNDVVIVCDAGGGTVDLISYKVKSQSPFRIEEATEGTGGICGSVILDEKFENCMRSILGSEYKSIPERSKTIAMKHWEDIIKPNFANSLGGGDDEDGDYLDVDHFIPLPGVTENSASEVVDGFLQLSGHKIKAIFDPVIDEIVDLVRSQIYSISKDGAKPKALMLVGGFGASEYLYKRLKKACEGIIVMQPPNAWSAVVQGAVKKGLDGNQVSKRYARRNYGIVITKSFPSKPNDTRAYWDDLQEIWKLNHQMRWYIKKGDEIFEDKPITMPFYRAYTETQRREFINGRVSELEMLYVYYHNSPPPELTESLNHRVPYIEVQAREANGLS